MAERWIITGMVVGREEIEEGIIKRQEKTFRSYGYVRCLVCGNGFMAVYICQTFSKCTV